MGFARHIGVGAARWVLHGTMGSAEHNGYWMPTMGLAQPDGYCIAEWIFPGTMGLARDDGVCTAAKGYVLGVVVGYVLAVFCHEPQEEFSLGGISRPGKEGLTQTP
jgi:hypothetical protein